MNLRKINNFLSLEKLTIQTSLRIVFIIIIFVFDFLFEKPKDTDIIILKLSFILVSITLSILMVLLIRFYERKVFLLYLQVFIDLVLTTIIVFLIQKTNFLITFLYLLSITNASIVLFRTGAFIAAISSTVLTVVVYSLMMNFKILTINYDFLINNTVYSLITYFSYATMISILTESLAKKDELIYQRELELNIEKQIKNIIIDKMYSGIIVVDNDGYIIFMNIKAVEILSLYEYRSLKINDLLVELTDFETNQKKEIKYKDKILGLTVTPLSDEQSDIKGFMIIFKDITDEFKLKETIKAQERLAYIGRISASIAHEIRNPLASISASLQIIPRFIDKNPQKIKKLTDIGLKEINRLNSLITDFLDYAKIDKLDIEMIDLLVILNDIGDLYEFKEGEDLIFKYNDIKKILINGDKNKLKQVFINLIKNGFEATDDDDKKIIIEYSETEYEYIISVKDSGAGIEEDILTHILEPFFTTKKTGTGLGLSLVNKFISLHNGRININSKLGEGTEFIIYLPKIKSE